MSTEQVLQSYGFLIYEEGLQSSLLGSTRAFAVLRALIPSPQVY